MRGDDPRRRLRRNARCRIAICRRGVWKFRRSTLIFFFIGASSFERCSWPPRTARSTRCRRIRITFERPSIALIKRAVKRREAAGRAVEGVSVLNGEAEVTGGGFAGAASRNVLHRDRSNLINAKETLAN